MQRARGPSRVQLTSIIPIRLSAYSYTGSSQECGRTHTCSASKATTARPDLNKIDSWSSAPLIGRCIRMFGCTRFLQNRLDRIAHWRAITTHGTHTPTKSRSKVLLRSAMIALKASCSKGPRGAVAQPLAQPWPLNSTLSRSHAPSHTLSSYPPRPPGEHLQDPAYYQHPRTSKQHIGILVLEW